jgi:hypothetical protein
MFSGNTENRAIIKYDDIRYSGNTSGITFDFKKEGFEVNQLISLKFKDLSNTNQKIFENYDTYKIISVNQLELEIDIENKVFNNFNTSGNTNGFYFEIKVEPKELLRCQFFGESEIEDERFEVNLRNLGIRIDEEIESLFEQSDIDDDGVDYILLNQKRKEMLLNYPELYNYIGSYKALINAVKFFGYDNLKLFEYYRNIESKAPMYQQLHKVVVPDIFDRTVEGYSKEDFIESQVDRNKYKKTNLFNLTYEITDDDGNYVLYFSTDEVQKKLEGIKKWLRKYILPLSSNILDITGVAETKHYSELVSDVSNQVIKFNTERESTAINFFIEQTLVFETNYLATINWYNIDSEFDVTKGWSFKVKTFSKEEGTNRLCCQQSFKVTKYDLEPFNFNFNKDLDPYIWIETSYYDENGIGMSCQVLRNMEIARNYYLINHKLIPYKDGLKYLNLVNKDKNGDVINSFYFFDKNGYLILSENDVNMKNKDPRD